MSEENLKLMAQKLRRVSILSTSEAGSGHPTTCMSAAEIVSVLFFHEMRFDPRDPHARDVDLFVLSKGHAAPILWAALHEAGAVKEDPMTLRKAGSPLEGHPTPTCPWVKVATGSLGQGLSAGAGMAYAKKMDGLGGRVFVLLGDGESAEGAVWEAAQFASVYKLGQLVAFVDVNGLGQSGLTPYPDPETYIRRFQAFGWNAVGIDGHSVREIVGALDRTRGTPGPWAIVARTVKGKGVSFLEGKEGWHGKPLKKGEELNNALREIGDPQVKIQVEPRRYDAMPRQQSLDLSGGVALLTYEAGAEVATREAYGAALVRLGKVNPNIVAIDGDTKNSTFSEKFKFAFPDRYVEAYIAEQNMVGVALGLATQGKVPFASTFACFLTRAHDFIRMAAYSRPEHLVFCGSHAGVSIGEDGPSQMGLEDLAMFRAIIGSTVLYPSDAVSAERLVEAAAQTRGIVYIRTTRPKTKVLYSNEERFTVGGSKVLRSSTRDRATIVAAGVTLHEALGAADKLKGMGIEVRVIDAYSVKPIDAATLCRAADETKLMVTVEDHSPWGGLGEAVASVVAGRCRVEIVGVSGLPRSAKPSELMEQFGLSSAAIERRVRELLHA